MRTTAFVLCAGTLCWPCVAPCSESSKLDRLEDGAGSKPAEHYGDGHQLESLNSESKVHNHIGLCINGIISGAELQFVEFQILGK